MNNILNFKNTKINKFTPSKFFSNPIVKIKFQSKSYEYSDANLQFIKLMNIEL